MFSRLRNRHRSPEQRKYEQIAKTIQELELLPRYVRTSTDLLGSAMEVPDAASFLAMYREIWEREIYSFKTDSRSPLIIDGGANVGVSVAYFKRLYPQSRVWAFEPDPMIFDALTKNVQSFGFKDVKLFDKALWSSSEGIEFESEGSDAGRVTGEQSEKSVRVETVRLKDLLTEPVDLLKLDIEGAETEVLVDCANVLSNVQRLFVEYHSFGNSPQTLHKILDIMSATGMRVHIHPCLTSPQPFQQREIYHGMDLQLNIFGFRN